MGNVAPTIEFQTTSDFYLFAELDPFWCGGRRCESIWAISGQDLFSSGGGKTLKRHTKKKENG